MKLHHLKGRKTCDRVLRQGNVWKGKTMVIRWLPGFPRNLARPAKGFFVGTLVSARVEKSAVKRNRMRRRCREALRTAVLDRADAPSVQLLLAPRSRSLACDYAEIRQDIRLFLSSLPS